MPRPYNITHTHNRRGRACPAPTNQITNQKIKNMKKITLLLIMPALMVNANEGTTAPIGETSYSVPPMNMKLGTNFELSIPMGRFEPFGKIGIHAKPIVSKYILDFSPFPGTENSISYFNTKKSTTFLDVGFKIILNKKNKLIGGLGMDNEGIKLYTGLKHKMSNFSVYTGIFTENITVTGKDLVLPGKIYLGLNRSGLELGLGYEHAINENLSINANVGYSHTLKSVNFLKPPAGQLTASIGAHYKLPLPKFEMRNLEFQNDFQPRHKQPKRTKIKKSKTPQRYQMIPCPPNFKTQKRSWKK